MLGTQRNTKEWSIPKNYAVIVKCLCTLKDSHANSISLSVYLFVERKRAQLDGVSFLIGKDKFIFISPVT